MDEETQALLEQIQQLEARISLYESWEIVDCEELWCIPDATGTLDCTGALCVRTALPEPSFSSWLAIVAVALMFRGRKGRRHWHAC